MKAGLVIVMIILITPLLSDASLATDCDDKNICTTDFIDANQVCQHSTVADCVSFSTPYLRLSFKLDGTKLAELRSDLLGQYNYSPNMIRKIFSARDFSSMAFAADSESVGNYTILSDTPESTSIKILSENSGYRWEWIVNIKKDKPVFEVLQKVSVPQAFNARSCGRIHQAITLNYTKRSTILTFQPTDLIQVILPCGSEGNVCNWGGYADARNRKWIDISGILKNSSLGIGIIMEPNWEYLNWYGYYSDPAPLTLSHSEYCNDYPSGWNTQRSITYYVHGDYLNDNNYTNDWKYTEMFYDTSCNPSNLYNCFDQAVTVENFSFSYDKTTLIDAPLIVNYKWLDSTSSLTYISMNMIYPSGRTRYNNILSSLGNGQYLGEKVSNINYDFEFFPTILNETGTYRFWLNAITSNGMVVRSSEMNFTLLPNPDSPKITLIKASLPFSNIVKVNTTNGTSFVLPLPFEITSFVNKNNTVKWNLSNDTYSVTGVYNLGTSLYGNCYGSAYNLSKDEECQYFNGATSYPQINYSDATLITTQKPHYFNLTILSGDLVRKETIKLVPQNTNISTFYLEPNGKVNVSCETQCRRRVSSDIPECVRRCQSNELNVTIDIEVRTKQKNNSYGGTSYISVVTYNDNPTHVNFSNLPFIVDRYYELESTADIINFLEWVYFKVYYNENDIPSNMSESLLRIYYYDPSKNIWIEQGDVNTIENYVFLNTTHFSIYSLQQSVRCGNNVCDSGESCSSCSQDCGPCSTTSPPGNGGGNSGGGSSSSESVSSGGGSSGFSLPKSSTTTITTTTTTIITEIETAVNETSIQDIPTGFVLLSPTNVLPVLAIIIVVIGVIIILRQKNIPHARNKKR